MKFRHIVIKPKHPIFSRVTVPKERFTEILKVSPNKSIQMGDFTAPMQPSELDDSLDFGNISVGQKFSTFFKDNAVSIVAITILVFGAKFFFEGKEAR